MQCVPVFIRVWQICVSIDLSHFSHAVVAERLRPLTSIPEVPGSNPGPAVAVLGQGALSSLPSLSEETFKPSVGPVYRRVIIPYARKKNPLHFSQRAGSNPDKWSDSTNLWLYLGGKVYGHRPEDYVGSKPWALLHKKFVEIKAKSKSKIRIKPNLESNLNRVA